MSLPHLQTNLGTTASIQARKPQTEPVTFWADDDLCLKGSSKRAVGWKGYVSPPQRSTATPPPPMSWAIGTVLDRDN